MTVRSTGWRISTLSREVLSNLGVSLTRSALIVGVAMLGGYTIATMELTSVGNALEFRAESMEAGAGLAIVSSDAQLDAAACEGLTIASAITQSGSFTVDEAVGVATAPGLNIQYAALSPGAADLWKAPAEMFHHDQGWVVGPDLAAELDLSAGDHLEVPGVGSGWVMGQFPNLQISARGHRWLTTISPPTGPVDQCWVAFAHPVASTDLAALGAVFESADGDLSVQPYLRADALSRDSTTELLQRTSQWGWAGFVVVLATLHRLLWQAKRRDNALYSILGTRRLDHLLRGQIEVMLLMSIPALLGCAVAITAWASTGQAITTGLGPVRVALGTTIVAVSLLQASAPLLVVPMRYSKLYTQVRSQQ